MHQLHLSTKNLNEGNGVAIFIEPIANFIETVDTVDPEPRI